MADQAAGKSVEQLKVERTTAKRTFSRLVNSIVRTYKGMTEEELKISLDKLTTEAGKVIAANDDVEASIIAGLEAELDTEGEVVLTGQQQADLEKTASECEGKLRDVKDLLQDSLWSTFGNCEVSIVLQAAETECERAVAIPPSVDKEAYGFILDLLKEMVKTAKEVHDRWKKWGPPDALRDVRKRLGKLDLQVPRLVARTAEFIQAKKEDGERRDPMEIPISYSLPSIKLKPASLPMYTGNKHDFQRWRRDWEALQKQGEPTGSKEVKKVQLLDSLDDKIMRDLCFISYNTADDIFRVLENRYGNKTAIGIEIVEELQRIPGVRSHQPRRTVELIQAVEKALPDLSDLGETDLKTQKIPKLECVQQLHMLNLKTHDAPKPKEQHERKKAELKSIQQSAVEVTLDPDTAHPALILSDDRKQVRCSDVRKQLPDSTKRFTQCVNVLGEQRFSSGRFYFEVQVKGKTEWDLGVAKKSIKRRHKSITTSPENGYWTMTLRDEDEYFANDYNHPVSLCLNQPLQKVGVFVNYEEGLVCFYDVDAADLLYAFTGCSFTEKLYPFFSPCTRDSGTNSAPLIICPVNHQLNLRTHYVGEQKEQYERKKADLKSMQQFAVEVTLDPDTAHPALILSDDGKQVHHGDVRKKLPDNPERFNSCVNVLGKQRFSSGKFYFEVQVKGKTAWTLGVAKKTVNRKGKIRLDPEDGFWTIWLRDGDEYVAKDKPSVNLSLKTHPQKVGVFVDYEEGLVCFYDVDAADPLYAFTDCSFTDKLVPYLSPCNNADGRNSAPLIISPVNPTG